jgi:hypothetical protein
MGAHPCYIAFRVLDEARIAALLRVFTALKQDKDRQIAIWEATDAHDANEVDDAGGDESDARSARDEEDAVAWILYRSEREWRALFDARALSHFRHWSSQEEGVRFLQDWEMRPRLIRDHVHPRHDALWDFRVLLRSLEESEIRFIACHRVRDDTARLEFEPLAYPYGGTACLKALIAAFDLLVVGEDDGFGYYAYHAYDDHEVSQ